MTADLAGAVREWTRSSPGRCPSDLPERAAARAEAALGLVGRPPTEELESRGLRIAHRPLRVGPVSVRARLDLHRGLVEVDPEALDTLAAALAWRGLPLPGGPRDLVLAHELFHLLDPDCPADLAEAAAHLFATRLLDLPWFAGTADLVERDFRRTRGR